MAYWEAFFKLTVNGPTASVGFLRHLLPVTRSAVMCARAEALRPSVCFQCEVMIVDASGGQSRKVLLSLFWALQGSLLSWCYLQLKAGIPTASDLARDILLKCEYPHCSFF